MELEITRELKNPEIDLPKYYKMIGYNLVNGHVNCRDNILAYIKNEIVGILNYENNNNNITIYRLYAHKKLKTKKINLINKIKNIFYNDKIKQSGYGIGSRLLYELLIYESGTNNVSLYSTKNAESFYEKIGFYKTKLSGSLLSLCDSGNNLSQIKKNLELRLKSPGYAKLTEDDLARLGIKNLETVV